MRYWKVQLSNHLIVDYFSAEGVEDLENYVKEKLNANYKIYKNYENFYCCKLTENVQLFFIEVSEKEYVDYILN